VTLFFRLFKNNFWFKIVNVVYIFNVNLLYLHMCVFPRPNPTSLQLQRQCCVA
jgi:hypothetical protein